MTQFVIYKSFLFVTELLAAEIIYMYGLRRQSLAPLRIVLGAAACYLFAFLFPSALQNAFYVAFVFLMIFLFTIAVSKVIFKEKLLTLFFCCIAGYTTQHLAYEIYNLILNVIGANAETPLGVYGSEFSGMFTNPFLIAVYGSVYVFTYFLCWIVFGKKFRRRQDVQLQFSFVLAFVIFILIVDILLNAIVVYYLTGPEFKLAVLLIGIYNILCCIVALYMQFEVALRRKLETTLDTVQRMWHQAKEQYVISKENIELINLKCHDLKHQIRSFGGGETISPSVLSDIENRISIYDSSVKTGNNALDVILTEKSLLCNKNAVKFSCIVDGDTLGFMKEEDIYTLFGNLVDNAIEAVLKLEPERRVISLSVKSVDDMVAVRTRNYFAADIVFENGLPKTTKADKEYHGYGMRSIKCICEQYNGDLSVKTEDDVFHVCILFFHSKV